MNYLRPAIISLLALGPVLVALAAYESILTSAATTFTINSTADVVDASPGDGACATAGGDCTLRAAIQETNALAGPDTITLPAGTYTFSIPGTDEEDAATGDFDITENLILIGAGAATTIIDGNHIDRVLEVHHSATTKISSVTIQNGEVDSWGAGVANSGDLTITDSVVTANTAYEVGGIFNQGTLTMNDVVVSSNTATSSVGGIANAGDATLTGVAVTGNEGSTFSGGILNERGSLTLTHSLVSTNRASAGGGILNDWPGTTLAIIDSTVSGNRADHGAGVFNFYKASATIAGTTVSANHAVDSGGGIANEDASVTLVNSTVSGNMANEGAGLHNFDTGSAALTNSTISNNDGGPQGGGIFNDSFVTLKNTIVANNNGGDCTNLPVTSDGHNLDSDGSCGLTAIGDLGSTDPLLAPLAQNGGPTLTHALLAGSPAIDAGDNDDCPPTDQRGLARPTGSACDIGAYEVGSLPVGGAVELVSEPSDAPINAPGPSTRDYATPVAVAVLAGAIALAASVWHARNRWLQ